MHLIRIVTLLSLAGVSPALGFCPDSDGDGVCDADDVCANRPDVTDLVVVGSGDVGSIDQCLHPDANRYPGGACLHSAAFDAAFTWTASSAGTYRFRSNGQEMLVGTESDCARTQLGCDASIGEVGSEVFVELEVSTAVRVVVSSDRCEVVSLEVHPCVDANGDGTVDVCCEGLPETGDSDGDEICDNADACLGDDASGDADGDGICDDIDPDCVLGSDAAGDDDGDGYCNDVDVCPTRPDAADLLVSGLGEVGQVDSCLTPDPYPGGVCLHSNTTDASFSWAAPQTGTFRITNNTENDGEILVGTEADCGLTRLACDNSFRRTTDVELALSEGDEVRIVSSQRNGCGVAALTIENCVDGDGDGVVDGACRTCLGNPRGDDLDLDGRCDVAAVVTDPLVAGQPLEFRVVNARSGASVGFLLSVQGLGGQPCLPNGECGDLNAPKLLTVATADAAGEAVLTANVPASAAGRTVHLQAAWYDGGTREGAFSAVETRVVVP